MPSSVKIHLTPGLSGKQITVTCEPDVEIPMKVGDIATFNGKPQRFLVVGVDLESGGFKLRPID